MMMKSPVCLKRSLALGTRGGNPNTIGTKKLEFAPQKKERFKKSAQ